MRTSTNALLVVVLALGVAACVAHEHDCEPGHDEHGCEHDHDHGDVPEEYEGLSNPVAGSPLATARGRHLFTANCAECHGITGRGDGPAGHDLTPPPANLVSLLRRPDTTDAYLYWRIAEGGDDDSQMPAWDDTLGTRGIWNVVAYLECMAAAPPCRVVEKQVRKGNRQ